MYVVEIRGNRSVAYIIEDGLKTCSRHRSWNAQRLLRRLISFSLVRPFLFTRGERTHVHERGLCLPCTQENTSILVHVSRQTRHNGYRGPPETPGFKTRARASRYKLVGGIELSVERHRPIIEP